MIGHTYEGNENAIPERRTGRPGRGNRVSDVEEREQTLAGSMVRASTLVLVGTVARVGLKFLLQLIIIRYLSRSEFGLFSLALAVANILAILSSWGLAPHCPAT